MISPQLSIESKDFNVTFERKIRENTYEGVYKGERSIIKIYNEDNMDPKEIDRMGDEVFYYYFLVKTIKQIK